MGKALTRTPWLTEGDLGMLTGRVHHARAGGGDQQAGGKSTGEGERKQLRELPDV